MSKTAPPPPYPSPQGGGDRVVPWASPVSQTSSPPPCGEEVEVGVVRRVTRARSLRRNATPPERAMWNLLRALRPMGFHFRRQVPMGRYFADFACHHPKLVVEVDGDSHGSARSYDAARDEFMQGEGYRVMRIGNVDVVRNPEGVGQAILNALANLATPTPNPTGLSLPLKAFEAQIAPPERFAPSGRFSPPQGGGEDGSAIGSEKP